MDQAVTLYVRVDWYDNAYMVNKPVAFICGCIAGIGLMILGVGAYYTLLYGHGNLEAGNFHRCNYWSERDPETGRTERCWETKWELTESTEGSAIYHIDTWVYGIAFVVLGASIFVVERSTGSKHALPY